MASFFKTAMHRVRRPSPSPSCETDTGSDTTRSDGQRRDSKRKGAELARPVMLDLKQKPIWMFIHFSFKPLQLASLVDPKCLETLESMGGSIFPWVRFQVLDQPHCLCPECRRMTCLSRLCVLPLAPFVLSKHYYYCNTSTIWHLST